VLLERVHERAAAGHEDVAAELLLEVRDRRGHGALEHRRAVRCRFRECGGTIGLLLGVLRYHYDRLAPGMFAHATFNVIAVAIAIAIA
jgi:hypothetical protein